MPVSTEDDQECVSPVDAVSPVHTASVHTASMHTDSLLQATFAGFG